ncbi:hypothetical protein CRUP_030800, partial [Coryphaenoides rupestris]
ARQPELQKARDTSSCRPCPVTASSPVCGSDGHNYASECKLQQQACLSGKELNIRCAGFCPCSTPSVPLTNVEAKRGKHFLFI